MSVRRTILIEPTRRWAKVPEEVWCAREYVEHGDESRTTRVLHTAPTREQVADWLAVHHRKDRREP